VSISNSNRRFRSPFNRALIAYSIRDGFWLFVSCFVALLLMSWARGWAVSTVNTESFQTILDALPREIQKLFPVDYAWLVTYTGRVAMTYEEPIIFLCLAIWCVARSSDCVSGQLGRGTLEMLLAQPVSRLQVLATHSAITVAGIVLLSLASWLGLFAVIQNTSVKEEVTVKIGIPHTPFQFPLPYSKKEVITPLSEKVNEHALWAGTVNFGCTGLMLAGLTTMLSALDRYRWRTIGLVTGFYIVQTLMVILSMLTDTLKWLSWFSIFSAYKPSASISVADQRPHELWQFFIISSTSGEQILGPLAFNLILISIAVLSYAIAAIIFQRRDLPAPV